MLLFMSFSALITFGDSSPQDQGYPMRPHGARRPAAGPGVSLAIRVWPEGLVSYHIGAIPCFLSASSFRSVLHCSRSLFLARLASTRSCTAADPTRHSVSVAYLTEAATVYVSSIGLGSN